MRALLDTCTFLWWIAGDSQLSPRAGEVIGRGDNKLYLSAASGWEIAIKVALGKLPFPGDLKSFIIEQMNVNGIDSLPVEMPHALHVSTLPVIHRDPFDRMLIAQAQLENLPILTPDPQIGHYEVEIIW
jgi:PIN domain nuclease of toxin-antitoxin system